MKLPDKQRRFVEEYCIDQNATQAYIRAGYNVKSEDVAAVNGVRLLSNAKIRAEVDERLKQLTERSGVTAEKVISEIAKVAFSDITDYLEVDEYEYVSGYEKDEKGNIDINKPIIKKYKGVDIFKTKDIGKNKIGAVGEIRQTKEGISLKLHDKMKALEMLGRNLKLFTDKMEVDASTVVFNGEDKLED